LKKVQENGNSEAQFLNDIYHGGWFESTNMNKSYRWGYKDDYERAEKYGIAESIVLLSDWSELDRFLEDFPNPNEPGNFDEVEK
jgi:uroporphyrinogen decarboxylase